MANSSTIHLGDTEYSVERFRLRKWLELEDIRADIVKATEELSIDRFVESVYAYIFMGIGQEQSLDRINLNHLPWFEVAAAYIEISAINVPRYAFPLLKAKVEEEKVAWDYDGRTWYIWSHALASEYGWNLEYIAELDIDDAIALLQEIIVKDQLEKEFEYGLSEIAYVYDSNSGKSKFQPMGRPGWMEMLSAGTLKKVKFHKSMLPVGNVVHLGGMDEALESE